MHAARNKYLYIAGMGMITPVGGNTAMTVAAVNARISQYKLSHFINKHEKPMTTSAVPNNALPQLNENLKKLQLTNREQRLVRMSMPALTEVLSSYPLEPPIPLFLAGPESLYSSVNGTTAKLLKYVTVQSAANIDLTNSRYFGTGRTGVLEAIALAFKYFEVSNARYVLVGGIDTYIDAATLGNLDAENRVLSEEMCDGFAPGEGASFLLLRNGLDEQSSSTIETILFEPGTAIEKGHRYNEEPYLGEGLSNAFKAAIANSNGEKISIVFSSMNGEHFFAKEYGVATIRNITAFNESFKHEHPIDCFGDMGAATAITLIALARHKLAKSNSATQNLVYCSSDKSNRAAVCVSKLVTS